MHGPFVILDFGRQVFGFPSIRMETSAGAVVDMIASPHLDNQRIATGAMRLGNRYIARDGKQTWEQFEYSQFRYLQVAVRSRQPVRIESVGLVAYEYPAERRGHRDGQCRNREGRRVVHKEDQAANSGKNK